MEENIIKYGLYNLDKGLLLRNILSEAIKSSFTNHYGLEGEQLRAFNIALGDVIDGLVNGTLDPLHGLGNFEDTSDKILDNDIYSKALEYVHKVANAVGTNLPKQNIRKSSVQERVKQPAQKEDQEDQEVVTSPTGPRPYRDLEDGFGAYFKKQTAPLANYLVGSAEYNKSLLDWKKSFNGDKLLMAKSLSDLIGKYGELFDYQNIDLGGLTKEQHQEGIANIQKALADGYLESDYPTFNYLNMGNLTELFKDDVLETPKTEETKQLNDTSFWDSLSDDDKIRIGTAGADVASALAAWIPGYGTAASGILGVGSTLTNAYLDFKDDKTSFWLDLGNLGFGLGMDIFGLIPGFGTGAKGAKLMKIVKPISKTLFLGFGSLGLIQALDVLRKMEDPDYELTTDDIRALSAGISTLVGGTTYLANKRQLGKVTTARDMAEVQTKSGKPAKITQEELAEIQKLEGFEAQNTKFKNITGGLELAAELKGRNLVPGKNFLITKNGPNVTTYTERNFVDEVPRKYRMLQWMNGETPKKTTTSTSETKTKAVLEKAEVEQMKKDAHKVTQAANEDNRIKLLRDISNRSKDLTLKQIDAINLDRGKKGLEPLTEKEIARINDRRKPTEDPNELREKNRKKKLEQIRQNKKNSPEAIKKEVEAAKAEYAEAVRQSLLAKPLGGTPVEAAPKGTGRTVAQIKKLAESVPTVKPKSEAKPVATANVPALIPKPIFKNIREIAGNNGSPLKTMQGLNQALAQKMHSLGLEAKMNRMIEPHAEEVLGRKRKEYLSGLVRNVQNLQVPELPRKPLIGAARTAKEKMYDLLFNERYYAMQEALRANKKLPHKKKTTKKEEQKDKKKKHKDRYVNRRALGGILFAKGGDTINRVNGTPILPGSTWYSAIGKHFREELAKGLRAGTYKNTDINSMQKQHQLIDSWGAGMVGNPTKNLIVKQYYENINNNYGFVNNLGIKAGEDASRYKVINGDSGDTFSKGWKADGYYSGRGLDRKLLGTINDYTKEELAETLDFWKKEGYDMKANDNGYYELHPINTNPDDSEKDDVNSEENSTKNNRKGKIFSIWGKGNSNNETGEPLQPFEYKVKRSAIEADDIANIINYFKTRDFNNELYDLSTNVPTLYFEPKHRTYYHRGDFNALMQGNQEEADVINSMSAMDTSDYMYWLAKRSLGIMLGKKAKLPYYEMDRLARRESEDFAWKVNSEVSDYNLANADKNAANAHQTLVEELGSKALQLRANLDSEVNLYNDLATKLYKRGLEEYLKNKENEETDKAIYTTLLNMDINKNPNNYILKWTNSHSDLWKRYLAGELIQDPNEINKLLDIRNQMLLAQLSRLYPNSRYLLDLPGITPVKAGSWLFPKLAFTNKKGGKLTKDMVDTIISYLKESNKNYHKDADRSVRGLYNFIKGQRKK